MIGRTLSHYQVVEKLGEGGMGEVYKAHDERLDRDVAIKVLPTGTLADEQARKRFRKEALALSKLNHPNIATVHDFDTQNGVDFIVMELVEGASLAEKVKTGPLPEKEISELGAQIADALEEAHERGIVHRDLKPGNVAVTPKGRVKVLDFGLARMLRPVSDEATTEALTQEQAVAGTLPYMSPEELRGERADHRSDLYSFGVVLYEMATGRRPFEHTLSTALANAIIHKPPEPPSAQNKKVSPSLENVILKALDKDPDHRYQSAREMRVDLERLSAPVSVAFPVRKKAAGWWMWSAATVAVVAVLAAVAFLIVGRSQAPEIDSMAVLPLENLSGDPEQEYFSDGMHDALIADLAKIKELRVISRQSVMRYRETDTPLPEIAQALNVDAIVEGSVLRSGDRVRVTTQLILANPERHLWSESYERELSDILSLQSEIVQQIVQEIQMTLTPQQQGRLVQARSVDPDALDAYLRGVYHGGAGRLQEANEYIQRAIEIDPNYAPAYAALSGNYINLMYLFQYPPEDAYREARAAAMKAIEIDETLAEGHLWLALVLHACDYDRQGAEREHKRAIELSPGLRQAHGTYSRFLSWVGRHDEAIAEAKRAIEIDPLSRFPRLILGIAYSLARRYDEAIRQFQELIEMHPNEAFLRGWISSTYAVKGMYTEATEAALKANALYRGENSSARARIGWIYALAGQRHKALEILDELKELSKGEYVAPSGIALVHVGLGENEEALQWLEKGYEKRDGNMILLKVSPTWDPLRDDPRFQDLLRRMNFPE